MEAEMNYRTARTQDRFTLWLLLLLNCLLVVGCGGDDDDSAVSDDDDSAVSDDDDSATATNLAITGIWDDNFGGVHTITNDSWSDSWGSAFHISQFDNSAQALIAQNDGANGWSPLLWSRFDWHWDSSDQLYYCQTCYDCADEEAALGTEAPDASDPANSGCGSSSWTALTASQ